VLVLLFKDCSTCSRRQNPWWIKAEERRPSAFSGGAIPIWVTGNRYNGRLSVWKARFYLW